MKKIAFFLFLVGMAVLVFSPFTVRRSHAQTYPSQPIQMTITLASGDTLRSYRQGDRCGDDEDPENAGGRDQ